MRTLLSFLKHSNIQIQIDLNPSRWRLVPQVEVTPRSIWLDDNYRGIYVHVLCVAVNFVIDDGSW